MPRLNRPTQRSTNRNDEQEDTIYNYRAKVKNKARISREDFEIRLMQIR